LPERLRRRYFAIKLETEEKIDKRKVVNAIWNAIYELFGDYGASKAGLATIDYEEEEKLLILRCYHKAIDMVKAAIAFITKIDDKPIAMHVIAVSGTIKALRRKIKGKIQPSSFQSMDKAS